MLVRDEKSYKNSSQIKKKGSKVRKFNKYKI